MAERTPRKGGTQRTLITSPYFSPHKHGLHVKLELDNPVSSPNDSFLERPDFMTFHLNLPMGPEIDMSEPSSMSLDEDDVRWFEEEFDKLKDPLYAFELRKCVYLRYKLLCAKPILIQEELSGDPWKVLVAVLLLNKTAGKAAIPIFRRILEIWPTPEALSMANEDELRMLIQPLGLQAVRAKRLIKLSSSYVSDPPRQDKLRPSRGHVFRVQADPETQRAKVIVRTTYPPTPISHLPGVGAYALDSYRIFCAPGDEWMRVLPRDKELIRFLRWKWAYYENKRWEPDRGIIGPLDEAYLDVLPSIIST